MLIGRLIVGVQLAGIVFDGTYMWVSDTRNMTVTRIRVSDLSKAGVFPTGPTPTEMAFDGANVWVVNSGSNTVSKF